MKNTIGSRASLFIMPFIIAWTMRVWFGTCRLRSHNQQYRQQAEKRGMPIIGSCWHYCILGIFTIYKKDAFLVMVSSSKDGEYLARVARNFGFGIVRGSRNRRGVPAVKELIKQINKGETVGLVADGSQGPPLVAQPGAILLASKTGGTILPVIWSASRYYTFNSWDRLVLPKLFSRINVFYGEPILVPKGIKSEETEEYRLLLEKSLLELYDNAWQIQDKKKH